MSVTSLPLSAGEDTLELHSAMEKQIRDLQVKQAELREQKAALEAPRSVAHLSQVNSRRVITTPSTSTPCLSLSRPNSPRKGPGQALFTPAPGHRGSWVQQRRTRPGPRSRTSPPPPLPVFEIPTGNRFAQLRELVHNAMIIGDSIVRQVPRVVSRNTGTVVLHAGSNDTSLRQSEILKRDFNTLVETVRTTAPTARIIVSGPLPTYQRGIKSKIL
ncbi:uncharacterized protein LOC132858012 [Tachysurus vachellii]|uniref:uncharacterized protein LOC132858012 n=1 Tax=Tachysurus vachellii TaxID=175792 RepID=UPI00296AE573|nr:uncharacterized protein LOC132858012 [Tachysurus vachellii]